MAASAVKFTVRMTGTLAMVGSSVLIALYLGASQAGYYFLGLTLVTIACVICKQGADNTVLRYVALYVAGHGQARAYDLVMRTSRTLFRSATYMVLGGFVVLFLFSMLGYMEPGWAVMWGVYLASVPAVCVVTITGIALQAAGYSLNSVFLTHVLTNGMIALAASRLAGDPEAPLLIAGMFLAGSCLSMVVGLTLVRHRLGHRSSTSGVTASHEPGEDERLAILKASRANYVSSIANLAILWIPLALLGLFSSPAQAALYGLAGRLSQVVAGILPGLNFVVGPRFSALHAQGAFDQLAALFRRTVVLGLLTSTALVIPVFLLSDRLLGLIGDDFLAAQPILMLMLVAQWVNGACGPVNLFLAMTGNEHKLSNMLLGSAVVGGLVGLLAVPALEGMGAALMSTSCMILLNLGSMVIAIMAIKRPGSGTGERYAGAASS